MIEITKQQLAIPIYLNEKIVLDMLAIMEDGFSTVSEVSTANQSNSTISGGVAAKFSTKGLLDKLLKIQLDGTVEGSKEKGNQETVKVEKVHTNVSLFSKFRAKLAELDMLALGCENIDTSLINPGDFIEVEGELRKNPMINIMEKFIDVHRMGEIFATPVELGSKTQSSNKQTQATKVVKQMKAFLNELKVTGTMDFILENLNTTVVLSAQEQYLENDNISEIIGGKFKVLGKAIKVCKEEEESISLLRKTTLDILDEESLAVFLSVFESDDLKQYNLPKVQFKISAPSLMIIPIAIYV